MREGVDDGYASKIIIELIQCKAIRSEGLDDVDLLINPVDDSIQGLRGVLFDGEEVLIGLEPGSRDRLDEGCLQGGPDLDWILCLISDVDLDLWRQGCQQPSETCSSTPYSPFCPSSTPGTPWMQHHWVARGRRTRLCTRHNHPQL